MQRIKTAAVIADGVRYVSDPEIRTRVHDALSHHLGLDIPALVDGAA